MKNNRIPPLILTFALVLLAASAAFAGVMDDAEGAWLLDPKTAQEQLPFDVRHMKVSKNTLTLKGVKKGESRIIRFTVKAATAATADLEVEPKGATLRLEMKSKKEMSIGELHNGKIRDVIYFKR